MEAAEMKVIMDTTWVLIAAILVFFMQAGFAMVEAGFTRAKNASNIIIPLNCCRRIVVNDVWEKYCVGYPMANIIKTA